MKRVLLAVAALTAFGMAAAPGAGAQTMSDGCHYINQPMHDAGLGLYQESGASGRFLAGEHITATAGLPFRGEEAPTEVWLRDAHTIHDLTSFPGTVEYTIPADGWYDIRWEVRWPASDVMWSNVTCTPPVTDSDDDGVIDSEDNCVNVANPDQSTPTATARAPLATRRSCRAARRLRERRLEALRRHGDVPQPGRLRQLRGHPWRERPQRRGLRSAAPRAAAASAAAARSAA